MTKILLAAMFAGGGLLGTPHEAQAGPDEFQSIHECTVGRRVADSGSFRGTVVGVAKESPRTLCEVRWDTTARKNRYIGYGALHAVDAGTTVVPSFGCSPQSSSSAQPAFGKSRNP